jgi:glutathione S-transferase
LTKPELEEECVPMLRYYSFGPGANSLKPMLALYEKELAFEHKLLNPREFEHHSEWYKAINPRGQVPALEDNGRIVTESTVICEYLEDAHPTVVKLRPDDHFDRAQMRIWTKWVDEYFCWCVSTIGWSRHVSEMVARIPVAEQQVKWRRAREGFPQDMLDEETRKIGVSVRKLDDQLADNEWLAGGMYSLADICNFSIANGMQFGFPEFVSQEETPHLVRWVEQINQRPNVQRVFANVPREF